MAICLNAGFFTEPVVFRILSDFSMIECYKNVVNDIVPSLNAPLSIIDECNLSPSSEITYWRYASWAKVNNTQTEFMLNQKNEEIFNEDLCYPGRFLGDVFR
jgi:hypothetical protein